MNGKEQSKRDHLYAEAEQVRRSLTYRTGYIILYVPRIIKLWFRLSVEHSAREAFNMIRKPGALTLHCPDPQVELDALRTSWCMRIGRLVLSPLRAVRACFRRLTGYTQREAFRQQILTHMAMQRRQMAVMQQEFEKLYTQISATRQEGQETLHQAVSMLHNTLNAVYETQVEQAARLTALQVIQGAVNTVQEVQMQQSGFLDVIREAQVQHIANLSVFCEQQSKEHLTLLRQTSELIWADVYADTIRDSKWLKDQSFSPGRFAVGYPFLYVMYRVLSQIQPRSILELGLGQSTKMIAQYVASQSDIQHLVIEADPNWIAFFQKEHPLSEATQIQRLPYTMVPFKNDDAVRVYDGFADAVVGKKYNFICIDAPLAGDMKNYGRIDIIDLLPDILSDPFVIMLDDTERQVETNTAGIISRRLRESNIPFASKQYNGEKSFRIWCSKELVFLCTM